MKDIPNWVQAGIAALLLMFAIIAFGVHFQDEVVQNRETIQTIHIEIKEIDDIVRDNQQRLTHIEALLNGRAVSSINRDMVE